MGRTCARWSVVGLVVLSTGCASLGQLARLVLPPRFEEAEGRSAEMQLIGPRFEQPLGGATVRIWMRVSNPNPFGFRLTRLRTVLRLDGTQAAAGDFPLGLPLDANGEAVVPVDLSISFADLPNLPRVVQDAAAGERIPYELEGTVGVDAGSLGEPVFGPMTLVDGDLVARR